jgi:hypothetical protein
MISVLAFLLFTVSFTKFYFNHNLLTFVVKSIMIVLFMLIYSFDIN